MSEEGEPHQSGRSHAVRQGLIASEHAFVQVQSMNFHNYGPSPAKRQSLRDSLCFREMKSRENAIECEHDGTCTWLLDTTQYALWRAEQPTDWRHRLLWIKGTAGAGKSTMMKFAVRNNRKSCRGELILPHFFNARGTVLEHSAEGMYRTFLHWLLKELPEETIQHLESLQEYHQDAAWQIPQLVELLEAAAAELHDRPTTFYIDALDECPEDQVRGMLKVFRKIIRNAWSLGQRLRVCFASRPYPYITFTDALFLDFGTQTRHLRDLQQYIVDELHIGTSAGQVAIQERVLSKAQGSFMWTVLVVGILNKEYDGGHTDKLMARVHEIPPGLKDLYDYTIKRYPENQKALLACCQWLIFGALRPTTSELWWATRQMVGGHQKSIKKLFENSTVSDLERYIIDISKGLVKFTGDDRDRRPEFLHESVREFFLDRNDLWRLCEAQDTEDFERIGFESVSDCCLAVLELERPTVQALVETHGHAVPLSAIKEVWSHFGHGDRSKHPLAALAASIVIDRVEAAQERGSNQIAFLKEFDTRCGPYFFSPEDIGESTWVGDTRESMWEARTSVTVNYSLISLLLEAESPELIRSTQVRTAQRAWEQGQPFALKDIEPYFSIARTLTRKATEAVDALLDVYLQMRPWSSEMRPILEYLALKWEAFPTFPDYSTGPFPPLLSIAAERPNLATLLLLVFAADGEADAHIEEIEKTFESAQIRIWLVPSPDPRRKYAMPEKWTEPSWQNVWNRELSWFLKILHLFLEHGLSSLAIDFEDQNIQDWISGKFEGRGGKGMVPVPPGGALEKLERLLRARQDIAVELE